MAEDILIPLIVFSSMSLIIISAFYFNFRKRRMVYDTIKVAIEKTGAADASLIEAIVSDRVGPYADLRKGIILIAVAAAFVVLGFAVGETEATGPLAGVAAFPGLVGIAFIMFHFFAPRQRVV